MSSCLTSAEDEVWMGEHFSIDSVVWGDGALLATLQEFDRLVCFRFHTRGETDYEQTFFR
jgi:hypothetical protein